MGDNRDDDGSNGHDSILETLMRLEEHAERHANEMEDLKESWKEPLKTIALHASLQTKSLQNMEKRYGTMLPVLAKSNHVPLSVFLIVIVAISGAFWMFVVKTTGTQIQASGDSVNISNQKEEKGRDGRSNERETQEETRR
jgi:hypothetical protein